VSNASDLYRIPRKLYEETVQAGAFLLTVNARVVDDLFERGGDERDHA
jgi:hypothetical protein